MLRQIRYNIRAEIPYRTSMKTLISVLLCTAVLTACPVKAAFANLKTGGKIETHGEMARNERDVNSAAGDDYRNTSTRVSLNAQWDMMNSIHAYVSAEKADRLWGTAAQSLNAIQTGFNVFEANVSFSDFITEGLNARLGMSFYGEPGDIIVFYGSQRMIKNKPTSACDMALVAGDFSALGMDHRAEAAFIKSRENSLLLDQDVTFAVLRDSITLTGGLGLGVAAYNSRTGNRNHNRDGRNLWIFDLRADNRTSALRWSAELALNAGSWDKLTTTPDTRSFNGWAAKAAASYPLSAGGVGITPRAGAAYGSGDNQGRQGGGSSDKNFHAISPDFLPGYIFGGSSFLSGIPGFTKPWTDGNLSNLTVWEVGADLTFTEKFGVELSGYNFWVNSLTANELNGDRCIGSELDLTVKYKFSGNIDASVYGARFFNGGLIKSATEAAGTSNSPAYALGTYLTVSF